VVEIRESRKKIQSDIASQQIEIRQRIGNAYADVLEVSTCLKRTVDYCEILEDSSVQMMASLKMLGQRRSSGQEDFRKDLEVANQVISIARFVADAPELLWTALEEAAPCACAFVLLSLDDFLAWLKSKSNDKYGSISEHLKMYKQLLKARSRAAHSFAARVQLQSEYWVLHSVETADTLYEYPNQNDNQNENQNTSSSSTISADSSAMADNRGRFSSALAALMLLQAPTESWAWVSESRLQQLLPHHSLKAGSLAHSVMALVAHTLFEGNTWARMLWWDELLTSLLEVTRTSAAPIPASKQPRTSTTAGDSASDNAMAVFALQCHSVFDGIVTMERESPSVADKVCHVRRWVQTLQSQSQSQSQSKRKAGSEEEEFTLLHAQIHDHWTRLKSQWWPAWKATLLPKLTANTSSLISPPKVLLSQWQQCRRAMSHGTAILAAVTLPFGELMDSLLQETSCQALSHALQQRSRPTPSEPLEHASWLSVTLDLQRIEGMKQQGSWMSLGGETLIISAAAASYQSLLVVFEGLLGMLPQLSAFLSPQRALAALSAGIETALSQVDMKEANLDDCVYLATLLRLSSQNGSALSRACADWSNISTALLEKSQLAASSWVEQYVASIGQDMGNLLSQLSADPAGRYPSLWPRHSGRPLPPLPAPSAHQLLTAQSRQIFEVWGPSCSVEMRQELLSALRQQWKQVLQVKGPALAALGALGAEAEESQRLYIFFSLLYWLAGLRVGAPSHWWKEQGDLLVDALSLFADPIDRAVYLPMLSKMAVDLADDACILNGSLASQAAFASHQNQSTSHSAVAQGMLDSVSHGLNPMLGRIALLPVGTVSYRPKESSATAGIYPQSTAPSKLTSLKSGDTGRPEPSQTTNTNTEGSFFSFSAMRSAFTRGEK
jgi:hypothetical protein